MWVPVYQTVVTHRKTLLGAQLAQMDEHKFLGHLVQFWLWSLDHTTVDGDLPSLPYDMLGQRAGLPKRLADSFIRALIDVSFLDVEDGHLAIHQWDKYGGRLVEKRITERERQRQKRGGNVASIERQRRANVAPTEGQRWPLDQIREEEMTVEEKTK